jgi:putative transposase
MVTAGTYQKTHHWNTPERLDFLLEALFVRAAEFGWQMQAWAILSNHYHFVATAPENPASLSKFLSKLHMTTSKKLNEWDATPGRKVWYQFWDSHITFEKTYLARLNYVNHNPAHHGAAENAADYRWCSAQWFVENAASPLQASVENCRTEKLHVMDDF